MKIVTARHKLTFSHSGWQNMNINYTLTHGSNHMKLWEILLG